MKDQVGKTIYQQITCGLTESGHSGLIALMCWGAHNFKAKECDEGSQCHQGLGSLHFEVIGSRFSGSVNVILDFNDTYRVVFAKENGKWDDPDNVVEEVKNVYFDQLTDIIDRRVEEPLGNEPMPECP